MNIRNQKPVEGPVEVLIVTHAKDLPWLEYALALFNKYCTGFQGVTVAYPQHQHAQMEPVIAQYNARTFAYPEIDGKGMLQHMVMMASPEMIVPGKTEYVMHMDADCMFHTPSTPEDFFYDDKPVYLYRTWKSLTTEDPNNPGSKVISDCAQWRQPTEYQLRLSSEVYTMCRHPTVFPMEFYSRYRVRIAEVHGNFHQFMVSGKNSFPQDRMDFTAMGQYAWSFMRDKFHWIDCGTGEYPADRLRAYWSHGGITDVAREEIEGFLNRYIPSPEEQERMSV